MNSGTVSDQRAFRHAEHDLSAAVWRWVEEGVASAEMVADATVRRLVAFYVDEHNRVIPHVALRGRTPDEMYFGADGPKTAGLPSLRPS